MFSSAWPWIGRRGGGGGGCQNPPLFRRPNAHLLLSQKGVWASDFTLEGIAAQLRVPDLGAGGKLFLVTKGGTFIASSDPNQPTQKNGATLSLSDVSNTVIRAAIKARSPIDDSITTKVTEVAANNTIYFMAVVKIQLVPPAPAPSTPSGCNHERWDRHPTLTPPVAFGKWLSVSLPKPPPTHLLSSP